MVDITHKVTTLREATAEAIVKTSSQATIDAIQNNKVPKGNVFEMAKAAGLLGVKKRRTYCPIVIRCPLSTRVSIMKLMVWTSLFR